jgi:hypothetical protein
VSSGSTSSAPGSVAARSTSGHLAAEAAGVDQHQALDALRELVGELHRDAPAERVADQAEPVVPERGEQVADAAGVAAERVVAARLGRLAVAEQVGRDDVRRLAEPLHHPLPLGGARGDAVDQGDDGAAAVLAGLGVAHQVAVHREGVVADGSHAPMVLPRVTGVNVTRPTCCPGLTARAPLGSVTGGNPTRRPR